MTCKDCVHYEACKNTTKVVGLDIDTFTHIGECVDFKDKNRFVEVVRCKDCKYGQVTPLKNVIICKKIQSYRIPNDFCSYGKRKEDSK